MTRRKGDCRIQFKSLTPCAPSRLGAGCIDCARHAPWTPANPMQRPHTVAIDAAVVTPKGGDCALRVQA